MRKFPVFAETEGFILGDPKYLLGLAALVWLVWYDRIGDHMTMTSGHISYDPANHQKNDERAIREDKGIADDTPPQKVDNGPDIGKMAIVGWLSYGPISRAVDNLLAQEGLEVSHIHIRNIWSLPKNLGGLLSGFDQVVVPEMNNGQMLTVQEWENSWSMPRYQRWANRSPLPNWKRVCPPIEYDITSKTRSLETERLRPDQKCRCPGWRLRYPAV